jgi:hypothetical protein
MWMQAIAAVHEPRDRRLVNASMRLSRWGGVDSWRQMLSCRDAEVR